MKTVELTGYVYFSQYDWEEDGQFIISQYAPEIAQDKDRKFITQVQVFVTVPDHVDMRQTKVDALLEEKKKLQADFSAAVTKINRKINELLAIENK